MSRNEKRVHRLSAFIVGMFRVSDTRKAQIYAEIEQGSAPRFNYYLLLLLSALIAAFGLIADSPAVVIGAMLVSPLMMPIFGISLSLITGDTALLRSALLAEIGGLILVVTAGLLVGISPLTLETTTEILNRTSPNLLDLFVAALAGFAGCMAMIDERISPILPGIAIATSLTPPLAACGLCLAFGAFEGGLGAFILFFANFLTILFIGGITFIAAGFIKGEFREHRAVFFKRFWLAAVSMIAIVFFLTDAMIRLAEEKKTVSGIKTAMKEELADVLNFAVRQVTVDRASGNGELNALVVIDAPREPTPGRLQAVEERLKQRLGRPVNVFVQTRITRNVTSSRNKLIQFYRSANGIEEVRRPGQDMRMLDIVGQLVRERMEQMPGMQVTDIELRHDGNGRKTIHTTVQGPIRPFPGGLKKIEQKVRQAVGDPEIRLVAHYMESCEITSDGVAAPDRQTAVPGSPGNHLEQQAGRLIRTLAALSPQAVKAQRVEGRWIVVAEVSGPAVMTAAQARTIQAELKKIRGEEVVFLAFSKAEAMVDGKPVNAD